MNTYEGVEMLVNMAIDKYKEDADHFNKTVQKNEALAPDLMRTLSEKNEIAYAAFHVKNKVIAGAKEENLPIVHRKLENLRKGAIKDGDETTKIVRFYDSLLQILWFDPTE